MVHKKCVNQCFDHKLKHIVANLCVVKACLSTKNKPYFGLAELVWPPLLTEDRMVLGQRTEDRGHRSENK